ncbi:MAG: Hsp20/alpha crystallin family protein [Kiritimatiellae bacterium]|nr:Hsp20/alpha crystallin family protein [Kiritimatiellia bacterium]
MTETRAVSVKDTEPRAVDAIRDRPVVTPATDIYETDEAIVVVADLPGLDQSCVNVELDDEVLRIRGTAPSGQPEMVSPDLEEFCVRDYERSFAIHVPVDRDHVRAQMKNGVLTVTLPFAPEVRPKPIKVEAE